MRISDWSSDVCSSDLLRTERQEVAACAASPDFRQQRFKVVHVISKIGCGPWATAMLAGPPSSGRFRLEREHVDMNLVRRMFSENLDGALFPGCIAGASTQQQAAPHILLLEILRMRLTEPFGARSEEHKSELQSLM